MLSLTQILQLICVLACCHLSSSFATGKKNWNFEVISIDANSSDENVVKFDLRMERIERGVYGVSGSIFFNADVEEGDSHMLETNVYRSPTGSSDYKLTPFAVKRQHVVEYINTFYKDVLMNSLKTCSDLPVFKDRVKLPIEKKTYTLTSCRFSNDGLPPFMSDGFYKVLIVGSGPVSYAVEGVAKVEQEAS